jgi:hypothetical protein
MAGQALAVAAADDDDSIVPSVFVDGGATALSPPAPQAPSIRAMDVARLVLCSLVIIFPVSCCFTSMKLTGPVFYARIPIIFLVQPINLILFLLFFLVHKFRF